MQWYEILMLVIFIVLANCLILGFICMMKVSSPYRVSKEEYFAYAHKRGYFEKEELDVFEEKNYTLKDGYLIHGLIKIVNPKKFVIFCHGHSVTKEASTMYAKMFHELGYSTYMYDHRGQGENKRTWVRMGSKESKDLMEIINLLKQDFGSDIEYALHGVSMGGATVMLSTQYQQDAKFIIDDCGYSQSSRVIAHKINQMHLPGKFLLPFTNIWFILFPHYSMSSAKPIKPLKNNKVPLMVIHGTNDDFVTFDNGEEIYNILTCHKKFYVTGAEHAKNLYFDRDKYKLEVQSFLESLD